MSKPARLGGKRRTTRWLYGAKYGKDTYIRVGRVYNMTKVPADIVRVECRSGNGREHDFNQFFTVDEAAIMATGIGIVLGRELYLDAQHVRRRYR